MVKFWLRNFDFAPHALDILCALILDLKGKLKVSKAKILRFRYFPLF